MRLEQEVSKKELRVTLVCITFPLIALMVVIPLPIVRAIIGMVWMVIFTEATVFATFGKEEKIRV